MGLLSLPSDNLNDVKAGVLQVNGNIQCNVFISRPSDRGLIILRRGILDDLNGDLDLVQHLVTLAAPDKA